MSKFFPPKVTLNKYSCRLLAGYSAVLTAENKKWHPNNALPV